MVEWRGFDVERVAIVIGETGVGKSTLVNMLLNHDTSDESLQGPCATGNGADSITRGFSYHANLRMRLCLLDTIGISDPQVSERHVIQSIRALLHHVTRGVNCIIIVMRMERVTRGTLANLALLEGLFSEQDLKTHGVLVLTHWPGDLGNEADDIKARVVITPFTRLTGRN